MDSSRQCWRKDGRSSEESRTENKERTISHHLRPLLVEIQALVDTDTWTGGPSDFLVSKYRMGKFCADPADHKTSWQRFVANNGFQITFV